MRRYKRTFGSVPGPYAVYGYTAMAMVLDAIERAGSKADQRKKVVDALIATRDFDSPIGTFSIDSNGDTSLERIAGYRITDKAPLFSATLRGERAPNEEQ